MEYHVEWNFRYAIYVSCGRLCDMPHTISCTYDLRRVSILMEWMGAVCVCVHNNSIALNALRMLSRTPIHYTVFSIELNHSFDIHEPLQSIRYIAIAHTHTQPFSSHAIFMMP